MSHTVERQIASLPALFASLGRSVFDNAMTFVGESAQQRPTRVVMSGSGDSLVACRMVSEALAQRYPTIAFAAIAPEQLAAHVAADASSTVVIAVSESGSSQEIVDAVSDLGDRVTVAVTNAVDSPLAKLATFTLPIGMEPGERTPGIRSFAGSIVGLLAAGVAVCDASGIGLEQVKLDCADLGVGLEGFLERLPGALYDAAAAWTTDPPALVHLIADPPSEFDAEFVVAKTVECLGASSAVVDSEGFTHIEFFAPAGTAALVLLGPDTPSRIRLDATAQCTNLRGIPTLVVNASPSPLGVDGEVMLPELGSTMRIVPDPRLWIAGTAAIAQSAHHHDVHYFGGGFDPYSATHNPESPFLQKLQLAMMENAA